MKKKILFCLLITLCIVSMALAEPVRLIGLKGPTSMGLAYLLEQHADDYHFELAGAPDEIVAKLSANEVDIAMLPANLASVLFNKTNGKIKVLDVNTLGVLNIVALNETIASWEDLKGKEIFLSGKGSSPEYVLNYLLTKNGIDPQKDVTLTFKNEHSEIVATLLQNKKGVALLPEPFVTIAQSKAEGLQKVMDLTKEWEKVSENTQLITGVSVVRSDYLENHKDEVASFLANHKESVEFTNNNVDEASQLIEKFDIFNANVAKKALPYCYITFIDGENMKTQLSAYLEVLFNQNPKAVGGTLPSEEFYVLQ